MTKISYYDGSAWQDIPGVQGGTGNFVGDASTITTGVVATTYGGTGTSLGAANPPIWYSPTTAPHTATALTTSVGTSVFALTSGAALAASTTYKVEGVISGQTTGSSSRQIQFDLNAPSDVTNFAAVASTLRQTSLAATNAGNILYGGILTNGTMVDIDTSAGSAQVYFKVYFSGTFRTNAAGNINPKIGARFSTGSSNLVVDAGSYISITKLGASTDIKNATAIGTWS